MIRRFLPPIVKSKVSFITFSFFSLSSIPLSHSLPYEQSEDCYHHPLFDCGALRGIGYPFWSEGIRSPFCGSDRFELTRPENENDFPSIQIHNQTFRVTQIDIYGYHMKMMRTNIQYESCSPDLTNTSSDDLFRYERNVKNVTLFYDCPKQISISTKNFTCNDYPDSKNHAFYSEEGDGLLQQFSRLNDCGRRIQVQISNETVLDSQGGIEALNRALGKGFQVQYFADPSCGKCMKSKGICGSNDKHQFTCYCPDGPHPNCSSNQFSLKNKAIVAAVTAAFVVIVMLTGFYFYRRRKKTSYAKSYIQSHGTSVSSMTMDPEINASKYFGVPVFTYTELEEATNNFDEARELGDGGFGTVYFGKLRDGRCVAVKRLYENNYKRVEQFINEVQILTRLRHTNLVSLYGCTSRHSRELLLVYEYIPNGTVADHLHGDRAKPGSLPWNIRMNIAIETASALAYLHASDIIHRDVKTNNILLDNHFVVKVADFGLSRLFPDHVTHVSTAPQGTPGYVDPEYHECYKLTDKSDVYSFGVVLIELISSLPAVDITRHRHEINLSTMAINKIQNRALHELVDPTLGFESDQKVRKMINAVAELAFQCLQNLKDMRPSMEEVLETLRDIESDGKHKSKPEVMDISDDVGLLKNDLPPPSSDSNLASKSTTSNSSS